VAAATAKYHNVANAIRKGYVPTNTCAELPGTGGMGYHYASPRLSSDNRLDPLHPEVLVYAPRPHGSRQLAALEYFKADDDQQLSTDKDRHVEPARPLPEVSEAEKAGSPGLP
jgi:hypothetical protein